MGRRSPALLKPSRGPGQVRQEAWVLAWVPAWVSAWVPAWVPAWVSALLLEPGGQ